MTPTERMHADTRKAEILKSALGVFAMKGFSATTTKDLAKAANVSEALLYKHFPSKENLYQELGSFITGESTGASSEVSKVTPSTQALVAGIYYLIRMVYSGPCGGEKDHNFLLRIMCRSLLEDGLFAQAFMENAFFPYLKPLQSFFEAARKSGDLNSSKKSDLFGIFFAHHLMVGIRLHALRPNSHLQEASMHKIMLEESVQFTLRGIGLKEAAIKKYFHMKKLDLWFTNLIYPHPAEKPYRK